MRPVSLGNPRVSQPSPFERWVIEAFNSIEVASQQERIISILEAYTVTNYTETRTLDASTATAGDVADFVSTLVKDLKAGLLDLG